MFFKLERGTIINLDHVVTIFHDEASADDIFTIGYNTQPGGEVRSVIQITKKDFERLINLMDFHGLLLR